MIKFFSIVGIFLIINIPIFSEKLIFEGDFKGDINYAESMGGFATEQQELKILANRIVEKDAELKYLETIMNKINLKLGTAVRRAEEEKIDKTIEEFKTIAKDLAKFNKNYLSNYKLIGDYQEKMESILGGEDTFGSGGMQNELLTEQENILQDFSRTLDKMERILKKDSDEFYNDYLLGTVKIMKEDKLTEERANNMRAEFKNFSVTLGKFYQNSAMLSKIILEEIQDENIRKLMELKIRRDRLEARIRTNEIRYEVFDKKELEEEVLMWREYNNSVNEMKKKGVKK